MVMHLRIKCVVHIVCLLLNEKTIHQLDTLTVYTCPNRMIAIID